MEKETPLISIIIPVYNVEEYLEKCLDSILKQKNNNYEIIMINDGSTDSSQDIMEKYAINHKNIVQYKRENKGPLYTRIEGIKSAKGKYVMFIDADDWLEENCLDIFEKEIKDGDYDIIRGNYNIVYDDRVEKIKDYKKDEIIFKSQINNKIYKKIMKTDSFNSMWRQVVKKEIIDFGIIDTSIFLGDDIIFNLACYKNINKMKLITDCVYNYRQNNISITHSISIQKLERNIVDLFKVYRILTNEMIKNKNNKIIKLSYLRYLKKANYTLWRTALNVNDEEIIVNYIDNIMENELTYKARKIINLKDIITKKEFFLIWLIIKNKKDIYLKIIKKLKTIKNKIMNNKTSYNKK